jgi:hypothetical protein
MREERSRVTSVVGGQVIVLASHPTWISAQRRAAERLAAINRHPSSLGKRCAQDELGRSGR